MPQTPAVTRRTVVAPHHRASQAGPRMPADRGNVESPENYAAMVRRERNVHAVEQALSAAARHVQESGADLPDPDPETGSGVSSDGLLTLSASQLAEARA